MFVTGAPVIVGVVLCGITIRRSVAMFASGNAIIKGYSLKVLGSMNN